MVEPAVGRFCGEKLLCFDEVEDGRLTLPYHDRADVKRPHPAHRRALFVLCASRGLQHDLSPRLLVCFVLHFLRLQTIFYKLYYSKIWF